MISTASWRSESQRLLAIALPLAAAQLGQMLMMISSSMILGRLGSVVLAAGGLSASLIAFLTVVTQGLLASMQPLIAQARGRGDSEQSVQRRTLAAALVLALLVSLPLILLLQVIEPLLRATGVATDIAQLAGEYCRAWCWGVPAVLCSAVLRYYLAAQEHPRIVMWLFLAITLLHFPLSWQLTLKDYGIAGAGYALSLCWWMVVLGLFCYCHWRRIFPAGLWQLRWHELKGALGTLLRLGWPIGGVYAAEMGLVSLSSLLIGRFGTTSLSAHMICLNLANMLFMVPLALGQATTVRVAWHHGRMAPDAYRMVGKLAMLFGAVFAMLAAVPLTLCGEWITKLFLTDSDIRFAEINQLTATLFTILALYLLFDGLQTIITGALRGLQDTRAPLFYCLLGYWGIAFPVGLTLAWGLHWQAPGLWSGYALGLASVSLLLLRRWRRKTDNKE